MHGSNAHQKGKGSLKPLEVGILKEAKVNVAIQLQVVNLTLLYPLTKSMKLF